MCLLGASFGWAPAAHAVELDDVYNVFADGTRVYVEPGAENVDPIQLQAVVDRAAQADINLYIGVVANGSERVDAELLRDALGPSTVLVFTPEIYRLATSDMCDRSFNAAREQANVELSTATAEQAASAFVEAALLQPRCTSDSGFLGIPKWIFFPLFLALLGVFGWFVARSFRRTRDAEFKAKEFERRRAVLREWAWSLREPLTQLNGPVLAADNPTLSQMYNNALSIAQQTETEVSEATQLPELDRAEMHIARAQMQVRDLQNELGQRSSAMPLIRRPGGESSSAWPSESRVQDRLS